MCYLMILFLLESGAKERKFLRDLLVPLVKHVMDDDYMDLETDPLAVGGKENFLNLPNFRVALSAYYYSILSPDLSYIDER